MPTVINEKLLYDSISEFREEDNQEKKTEDEYFYRVNNSRKDYLYFDV